MEAPLAKFFALFHASVCGLLDDKFSLQCSFNELSCVGMSRGLGGTIACLEKWRLERESSVYACSFLPSMYTYLPVNTSKGRRRPARQLAPERNVVVPPGSGHGSCSTVVSSTSGAATWLRGYVSSILVCRPIGAERSPGSDH